MLVYAVVTFGVVLFENRPGGSWLAAGLAVWGGLLATQTTAYYVVGIGIGMGLVGLLVGRFVKHPLVNIGTPAAGTPTARVTLGRTRDGTTVVAAPLSRSGD